MGTIQPVTGKGAESIRLATARVCIWEGAVRSAKTVSSLMRWLRFVREAPPGNLLMVGKTERTLRRNVIDFLVELVGPTRCRFLAGSGELWLLGRRIYVAGANDERARDKIQGLTLVGAYCDELSRFPESFWEMLRTRMSEVGAQIFATSNPEGPYHWLKTGYLDRARVHLDRHGRTHRHDSDDRLNLARFSFQLSDNPHLPAEYIDDLTASTTGLWYKRLILGEWSLAEGAIYDAFDPDAHVVDTLPEITRWISTGIDYGTTNPFSAILLGVGADRRLYVTSEYRWDSKREQRKLTDAQYSAAVRDWLKRAPRPGEITGAGHAQARGVRPEKVYVDPSAASFMTQLWHDKMPGVGPADNAVIDGIRSVSSVMSLDRLRVHRSCRGLLDELPAYAWDDDAAQKGEDAPVKSHDHSVDALRYGLHSAAWLWRPTLRLPVLDLAA
ncbi:PBSX family phage terminase large subunit [Nocardiopsis tropica]|uniref:PBSX family phage terminase large subunit n=1 Tax=Nocardiopsis tropica TaxID=109330 RepID=A0ABU7KNS0_9ACTN|nr:PBSX family phage terminase large subunit [Nocardiopsis umidischolae]MEE2050322.1 PBSX family phage terminase large subunit [Nocardiopsis umidischolae]